VRALKNIRILLASALLAVVPFASAAGSFDSGPVSLRIPAGFDGPISGSKDGGTTTAFRKRHPDSEQATILQVTVYDFGSDMGAPSEKELADGTEQYLKEFLGGIERRRTDFVAQPVQHIQLGGVPAAKVQWNGRLSGMDTVGVMYCLIVGTRVVSLHTQDSGTTLTPSMKAAISAIEALQVAR
jgi:hypothetical protein